MRDYLIVCLVIADFFTAYRVAQLVPMSHPTLMIVAYFGTLGALGIVIALVAKMMGDK